MKHHHAFLTISVTVAILIISCSNGRADLLVDSFTDQDFVAQAWGNGQWKDQDTNTLGQGTASRSTDNFFAISVSGKPAQILQTAGDAGYKFLTGSLPGSTAANVSKRLQSIMLTLQRTANYDATTIQYVRLTAWRDSAYAVPADAAFGLSMAQSATLSYPRINMGPWDATGTNFVGLPITTTPAAYVVPIKDTNRFKADPAYQTATGVGAITKWGEIRGIAVGWRRAGATAGTLTLGPAPFVLDDLMMLTAYPRISVSGSDNDQTRYLSLTEAPAANTATFTLALKALPSHNVTIHVAVPDADKLEVSSDGTTFGSTAAVTFTTANYATAQTITVRSKEGSLQGSTYDADLVFSRTTSDLWYGSPANAPIATVHVTVTACVFGIPSSQSVGFAAQTGLTVAIDNSAGGTCSWTAATSDPWITSITPSSGTGSQTVSFGVLANAGPERTGTITVAGHSHTVTQAAAPPPPQSSILTPADTTIVGQTVSMDFVAFDHGGGIASTQLWVKTPGSAAFVSTGLFQAGATGSFIYTAPSGEENDGIYQFACKATDTLGNSEPDPVAADASIIFNTDLNSPFTWSVVAGDSETTYPMTPTQDVFIRVSGATEPGQITVSRSSAITPPDYFRVKEQVVKESLAISKTGLGTFTAELDWQIDPAMALGVSPVDRAFAFEGEQPPVVHNAVRNNNTVSVTGLTAFSTWYLGNAVAVPVNLSGFSID